MGRQLAVLVLFTIIFGIIWSDVALNTGSSQMTSVEQRSEKDKHNHALDLETGGLDFVFFFQFKRWLNENDIPFAEYPREYQSACFIYNKGVYLPQKKMKELNEIMKAKWERGKLEGIMKTGTESGGETLAEQPKPEHSDGKWADWDTSELNGDFDRQFHWQYHNPRWYQRHDMR